MKKLYLVRHAKSSWDNNSLSDIERPLSRRGLKNAPDMASRLYSSGVILDLIISSPAGRAISTAQILASSIGYDIKAIQQQQQLYFRGVDSMLDIIKKTHSSVQSLMLVGHNPDMTSLFNKLCGYQTENMPTCAVACIHFDDNWQNVRFNSGRVFNYSYPKKQQ